MIKSPTVPLKNDCFYHIYNRGNNGESIFRDEVNYAYFLQLWKNHISPVADTYAYCLLNNHFHSLIRIKADVESLSADSVARMNIAEQHFANFFNAYAKAFNKRYNRTGKLFEERFKRKPVDNSAYFTQLIYYIHSNPFKHGFVNDFRNYAHSSYRSIMSTSNTALMRNDVLEWFGGREQFAEYHSEIDRELGDLKHFEIED